MPKISQNRMYSFFLFSAEEDKINFQTKQKMMDVSFLVSVFLVKEKEFFELQGFTNRDKIKQ